MKKLLALLGCVVALSIGCGSSAPTAKVPVAPAVTPSTKDIKMGSWVYTVPYNFEERVNKSGVVAYWSPGRVVMVAAATDSWDGPIQELVAEKVDILTGDDLHMTILGIRPVDVDGTEGAVIVAKNETVFLISLVTVENKHSFGLTCAGYLAVVHQSTGLCAQVLASVKHSVKP